MNMINDFFQYDFLFFAFLGTLAISLLGGLLSPFIIARSNAFMGAAISHSTLLSLSVTYALFRSTEGLTLFFWTLLFTLILTSFIAYGTIKKKMPSDGFIGIFYSATLSLGVNVHNLFNKENGDMLNFLFGNILTLSKEDIYLIYLLLIFVVFLFYFQFKNWIFITFDEDSARVLKLPVNLFHLAFYFLLTILIVTMSKIAGTILIEAFLLIPGFLALSLSKNLKQVFAISIIFSLTSSIIGLIFSNYFELPSGATLAATQFLLLALCLILKKSYNLIIKQ